MSASEIGTEHPDARGPENDGGPDEEELANPTVSDEELDGDAERAQTEQAQAEQAQAGEHEHDRDSGADEARGAGGDLGASANDELIDVEEARERSGGDTADAAESTTEHDRAERFS